MQNNAALKEQSRNKDTAMLHAVLSAAGTSSIEQQNKYETIEKSLSPYKITEAASTENVSGNVAIQKKRRVNVSIRKQLELQHPNTSSAAAAVTAASPTSPLCSTVGQVRLQLAMAGLFPRKQSILYTMMIFRIPRNNLSTC